jgi:multidrug efflux pump subunit AcrA (membrane-fusion protein)
LQGKYFVWLVGPDNKVKQQLVKVGEARDGIALVLEGLKTGDRIVVEGLQKMREGAAVTPVNPEPKSESTPAPAKE